MKHKVTPLGHPWVPVPAHRAGFWDSLWSSLPWTVGWAITDLLRALPEVLDRPHTVCSLIFPGYNSFVGGDERGEHPLYPGCARLHGLTHKVWDSILGQINPTCFLNSFSDTARWHSHCWYVPQGVVCCRIGAIFLFTLKALQWMTGRNMQMH